jgi:hypothetical protein
LFWHRVERLQQQPRSSRSGRIDGRPSSNGPKRLGVAQPFLVRRQWKRFLPLGARTGEAVLRHCKSRLSHGNVAGFWILDLTTITGRSAVILRHHTAAVSSYDVRSMIWGFSTKA